MLAGEGITRALSFVCGGGGGVERRWWGGEGVKAGREAPHPLYSRVHPTHHHDQGRQTALKQCVPRHHHVQCIPYRTVQRPNAPATTRRRVGTVRHRVGSARPPTSSR